jgi:hypothetical protein
MCTFHTRTIIVESCNMSTDVVAQSLSSPSAYTEESKPCTSPDDGLTSASLPLEPLTPERAAHRHARQSESTAQRYTADHGYACWECQCDRLLLYDKDRR